MNIMDVARSIGLVVSNGEVAGTIDQQKVLGALAQLTEDDPARRPVRRRHSSACRTMGLSLLAARGPRSQGSSTGRWLLVS
jgi:hypothetical protein